MSDPLERNKPPQQVCGHFLDAFLRLERQGCHRRRCVLAFVAWMEAVPFQNHACFGEARGAVDAFGNPQAPHCPKTIPKVEPHPVKWLPGWMP